MTFLSPDFSKSELELRLENGIICIYGTPSGLEKLAKQLVSLSKNPNEGHIHLNNIPGQPVLTKESLPGAIAVFDA